MTKKLLICTLAAMAGFPVFSAVRTVAPKLSEAKTVTPKKALKPGPKRHGKKQMLPGNSKSGMLNIPAKTRDGQLQIDWGYCEDPYNAFQLETYTVNQAIYVSEEKVEELAGASVNAVLVGTPANPDLLDEEVWEYGNDIESVTVWLTYDLEGEHFAEATGKFESIGFTWTSVPLSSSYIIEKDKPFYVGVTYDLNIMEEDGEEYSPDYGWVTDYGYPDASDTNLIYTSANGMDEDGEFTYGEKASWKNLADYIGNASIRINITGDNLPVNTAIIADSEIPTFVDPADKLQVLLSVKNLGAQLLETVDVCLEYEDGAKQTVSVPVTNYNYDYDNDTWEIIPTPIPYFSYGILEAYFDAPAKEGYSNYTITIPSLNGSEANKAETSIEGMVLSLSNGYHKNNVVEEGTGTWCGNCPFGYVGMHWLADNCEENAIGIALHYDDPMDVLMGDHAYAAFENYIEGYPSSFFNRNWSQDIYPDPESLEEQMDYVADIPALAEIKASLTPVSEDGKTVRLDTTAEFSLADDGGSYGIAYTVVEDGVGPYRQTNYMSGDEPGSAYGFEDLPKYVQLIFDDVARNCSHPEVIENSLPDDIASDTPYDFSTEIELSDVTNLNNYRVIPMIINTKSGYVENACVVKSPTYDYSAVKSIHADKTQSLSIYGGKGVITISGNTENIRIYSSDGRYVGKASGFHTSVAPGFYIVTNGSRSAKVIVR